jgi:fermentation-respiration switch protein FrsA (DUF1100 family)
MRMLIRLLATGFVIYALVVATLYVFQRQLMFRPDTSRPILGALSRLGVGEVTLATADGLALLAWYLPPPDGAPVIVYFHGNGGHLGYRNQRMEQFATAGFGVLMPEYRGYGGNPGNPSAAGFYLDAEAAVDFLAGQHIASERQVFYGESLGTGVAVWAAAQHEAMALVLEAPFTSAADIAQDRFPWLPARLLLKDRFDSLSLIGKVRAPIFVMQAEDDLIVPVRFGRALFAAAPEPKEALFAPAGGHFAGGYGGIEVVIAFLRRRISGRVQEHAAQ